MSNLFILPSSSNRKNIGINEDLHYSFASYLEQKSRLFVRPTEIRLYNCSLFDDEGIKKTLGDEEFNFVLVSKTLHHLRTGKCVMHEREEHKCIADAKNQEKHKCRDDEKCCIYKFKEKEIFKRLFRMGNRAIIHESYYPHEKDNDKVRGRGGYSTVKELEQIFKHLLRNYRIQLIRPIRCRLDKKIGKSEGET